MIRVCFTCTNIIGCHHLSGGKGEFLPEKVIREEGDSICAGWAAIGDRQLEVRSMLYRIQGEGCLRVLHQSPPKAVQSVIEQEEEDSMTDMPPFATMILEGMTTDERREQLQYETDLEGNTVLEGDMKVPRPVYQLRKYACDPEGPIGLPLNVCMYWNTQQLLDHVVKAETESGLIAKAKKSTKKDQKPENEMEGKRVVLSRKTSNATPAAAEAAAGQKVGVGKVARPPRKTGAAKVTTAKEPPAKATEETKKTEAPGEVNRIGLGDIEVMLGDIRSEADTNFKTLDKRVMERMDELENKVTNVLLATTTILHDLLAQTGGTMQYPAVDENGVELSDENGYQVMEPMEDKFSDPNKILSYLDEDTIKGLGLGK